MITCMCCWPVQVCQDSVAEARRDADSLSSRHTQLRRRCRQLYNGYRGLRYKLEDEWPQGTGAAGPCRGLGLLGALVVTTGCRAWLPVWPAHCWHTDTLAATWGRCTCIVCILLP